MRFKLSNSLNSDEHQRRLGGLGCAEERDTMMISRTASDQCARVGASIALVAAGLSITGIAATGTANAADAYVAVSVGLANDNPPVQTIGGMAIGPDADQARIGSLTNCQNNGGNQ